MPDSTNTGISAPMMLRRGQRTLTLFAAFAAGIAILFYAFCAPVTHSPLQHSAHMKMVAVEEVPRPAFDIFDIALLAIERRVRNVK